MTKEFDEFEFNRIKDTIGQFDPSFNWFNDLDKSFKIIDAQKKMSRGDTFKILHKLDDGSDYGETTVKTDFASTYNQFLFLYACFSGRTDQLFLYPGVEFPGEGDKKTSDMQDLEGCSEDGPIPADTQGPEGGGGVKSTGFPDGLCKAVYDYAGTKVAESDSDFMPVLSVRLGMDAVEEGVKKIIQAQIKRCERYSFKYRGRDRLPNPSSRAGQGEELIANLARTGNVSELLLLKKAYVTSVNPPSLPVIEVDFTNAVKEVLASFEEGRLSQTQTPSLVVVGDGVTNVEGNLSQSTQSLGPAPAL